MGTLIIILSVVAVLAVVVGAATIRRRSSGEVLEPSVREGRSGLADATQPVALRDGEAPFAPEELDGPEVEVQELLPGVLPREVLIVGPEVDEDERLTDEELEQLALGDIDLGEQRGPSEAGETATYKGRLGRARATLSGYLGAVLARSEIDQAAWDELEEALLLADVGIGPASELLDAVRSTVRDRGLTTTDALVDAVKDEMKARLRGPVSLERAPAGPTVWLFVGVNGVGKTTTIGKVGHRLSAAGDSVIMAAGDTFRAAAAEQLGTWADRCGAQLVRGNEGGDPSAVVFDAISAAAARGADVVLADTAGRLHTRTNLMEELRKVRRVAEKAAGTVTEVLLVLDATTGQNGLQQARQFTEATELTGVVLTKLDGSAKGGIVFAIRSELGIPVKLVGLGESASDLVDFDADEFVDALFTPLGD
ncbi:MAG: signal recognition particle-docking protein FtsY [Actinomycetes bacterium]